MFLPVLHSILTGFSEHIDLYGFPGAVNSFVLQCIAILSKKKCTLWVFVFNGTHKERSKKESNVFYWWEVSKCFAAGKVPA